MPNAHPTETRTDRALEGRIHAAAGDAERVAVIEHARAFKRSWIELAESLARVADREAWKRWGYDSFDSYVKQELSVTPATAAKLLGSFRFLKTSAPRVLERSQREPAAPVPSLRAVDFVAKAVERGAADTTTMSEIRRAAFDDGVEVPMLSRRFKSIAFPVDEVDASERLRTQLVATARRLATLLAEEATPVPKRIAVQLEEALGELLAELDEQAS